MGRGRAKGKKPSVTNQEDVVSGAEEKIPAQKRRGRPQKSARDGIEEDDEGLKIEDEDSEDTSVKETKSNTAMTSDGKKRKRNAQGKDKVFDLVKEGNGTADSNESNGFRQTGNRRKNKPHRAAEAVVECN
ncbi:uncharacterized protein [Henckelia pumila]|uniref:uncharacterized protein n=1 Tax=Henckelia pumila TaxID=405737 RepID=UPI003C6E7AE5